MPLGNDVRKAKLLALFQFSVRGIPFTYYGEELGIEKPKLPLKTGKDPLAQRYKSIPQFMVDWTGQSLNRDECRTPMLWDTTTHAGFTSGTPWLPVAENFKEIAVSVQEMDGESLMSFYRKMLQFRNENEVLQIGNLTIDEELSSSRIFAFHRELENERFLVLMNFTNRNQEIEGVLGNILISTYSDIVEHELKPFEGRVVRMN